MPIAGWICVGCGGRQVPLDHFESTGCDRVVDPAFARAVLANDREQAAEIGSSVRVSDGFGCPRKRGIMFDEQVHVNPLNFNSSQTGVAWHALLEKHGKDIAGYQTEKRLVGHLAGVEVTGKPDRVVKEKSRIEDHKHQNDFASSKGEVKQEWKWQLSLYGELTEQVDGLRPTVGRVRRHHSIQYPPADDFQLLPLDEVLASKPHGGPLDVESLYQVTRDTLAEVGGWKRAPLSGKSMQLGKKTLCDYCPVFDICTKHATGAPF